jgi:fructokinase
MYLGVDWGGTKIEVVALSDEGKQIAKIRKCTPKGDYDACIELVAELVEYLEARVGVQDRIGVGIPGSINPSTNRIQNANSIWLNNRDLMSDLSGRLTKQVRLANDANCLAVSEAHDGAASGASVVFAAILGTGCGGGVSLGGVAHEGKFRIAGEWGHNQLPWLSETEITKPRCYCGKNGCIETFVSGVGFQRQYTRLTGQSLSAEDVIEKHRAGDRKAGIVYRNYVSQLSRALSSVINVLDPDCIVLGGGMSNIEELYLDLPSEVRKWVLSDNYDTPILQAKHGDSSGVRGAAWLWRH